MKKPFEAKAKRLYSIFASVFFMLAVFVVPAFAADGDPLAVVKKYGESETLSPIQLEVIPSQVETGS